MRSFVRRSLTLATLAAATVVWSGCEGEKQTEYVTGISTQVQVPRDLKAIRVEVSVGGVSQFCQGYRVYEGRVLLPRSLGTIPQSSGSLGSGPITYTILGLTEDFNDGSVNPLFSFCAAAKVGENNARILRRSRQPYIKDEIRFLPMPLKYACYDKVGCTDEQTCKGGRCVPIDADLATLPKFDPELVDGTGASCFSLKVCLGAAAPAIPVDQDTCTYAVPNTQSEPPLAQGAPDPIPGPSSGDGVNVEVVFDGGLVREVLDKEPDDGFVIPDPAKPQQFRLSPGLCDLVKGFDEQGNPTAHRITAVRASGTCQSKQQSQPICAGEAFEQMGVDANGVSPAPDAPDSCKPTELKLSKAALMVVVDNTTKHQNFFGQTAETAALNLALKDPAFDRTDIGLTLTPGQAANACAPTGNADVPPELARDVRPKIATLLGSPGTLQPDPVAFEGALSRAYATLEGAAFDGYFRRAVLVIGNRDFNAEQCGGIAGTASTIAQAKATDPAKPIQTYVLQLIRNPDDPNAASIDPGAFALAAAGGTTTAVDARTDKAQALSLFDTLVESLATCVYDAPAAQIEDADVISYTHPVLATTTSVKKATDGTCSDENGTGNGWGFDPNTKRVFFCGTACSDFRKVLREAPALTLPFDPPKPRPPIPVFFHKAGCAPK